MPARVEIFTTPMCPYCVRAKSLLAAKGVQPDEIDIWVHPDRRPEMVRRAGGRTSVPQIFINGDHVGGCDDLVALDSAGALDGRLQSPA